MKSNRGQRSFGAFVYELITKPSITSVASFKLDFMIYVNVQLKTANDLKQ